MSAAGGVEGVKSSIICHVDGRSTFMRVKFNRLVVRRNLLNERVTSCSQPNENGETIRESSFTLAWHFTVQISHSPALLAAGTEELSRSHCATCNRNWIDKDKEREREREELVVQVAKGKTWWRNLTSRLQDFFDERNKSPWWSCRFRDETILDTF